MIDFVLKFRKKFMLGRLGPQAPHAFGLNPPIQLVIGYHWLVFLKRVRKPSQVITSLVPYLKNTKLTHELIKSISEIAHLLGLYFFSRGRLIILSDTLVNYKHNRP